MEQLPINIGSDAELFAFTNQLIGENKNVWQEERRGTPRFGFGSKQLMAPIFAGYMPTQSDFRHVLCCDLSGNGFSYWTKQRPNYDQLVVALGRLPLKFLIARVAHITAVADLPAQRKSELFGNSPDQFEGTSDTIESQAEYELARTTGFVVGCQFQSRITE